MARIAKFLGWREFVAAFIIALGTSISNLFVGVISALHKIPQLSFGDILGGNVIDLTLVMALAIFFTGGICTDSRTVRSSSLFTLFIAFLPLVLALDGNISRVDGMVLIMAFFPYVWWLFSKNERFSRVYDGKVKEEYSKSLRGLKLFFKDIGILLAGLVLLLLSSEIIVRSATYFSENLGVSIMSIGILIVALGNCLPEAYFSIASARAGQTWMILGNLMGSVIVCSTLVLGVVALIYPIQITDFSPFAAARFFLVISSLFFLIFLRTDRKLTRREGLFLLLLYISFVITEILIR